MKKTAKIVALIIAILTIYSILPVASLYLRKDAPSYTNDEAAARLKGNEGELFAFIVLGDNHAGVVFHDSAMLKMIRHINREDRFRKIPIDFVAIAGDITYRGSAWDYRNFNKIRSLIRWPVICAIGNHDCDNGGAARFAKYVGKREFSFTDRNSYFIVVDNEDGTLSDRQFEWLESELKKSASFAHRFVIIHKAPVSSSQQSWFRPESNPWSYRFMQLCSRYRTDIVFSGHEHLFKDRTFAGVRYVTTSGGGILINIPESEGGFMHYLVVRVYGDHVDYEVRRIFPPLWEYLVYYMWKEIFYSIKAVVF